MNNYFFRNARVEDVKRLVAFVNAAYRGESSKAGWTTEEALLDGIRTDEVELKNLIDTQDSWIMLCFQDPKEMKLLSSVHLKKENASTLYLGMLTVDPKLQAGGIGKAVLNQIENIARTLNCATVRMSVIQLRHELIAYYERRGFVMTGKWEPFPEGDARFGFPKVQGLKLMEMKKAL